MKSVSVIRENRATQVIVAMIAMILISLYEYTFTLFEKPISQYYHWSEPTVATVFTVYMLVEAFAMLLGGRLADRIGPRWVATLGGILSGLGWILASHAKTPATFYLVYAIGSLGPGLVYACCIASSVKWFSNQNKTRGLITGLVTGSFGAGSALFIPMISKMVKVPGGFMHVFTTFGVVMMIGIVVVSQFMAFPRVAGQVAVQTSSPESQFTSSRMIRTRQFWLLWIVFLLVVGAGQMTVAHIATMGANLKFAAASVAGIITLSRLFNGIGRVVIGSISDRFGRSRSMAVFFTLMAICLYLSTLMAGNLTMFGILSVATLFFWGPIFTLVPATMADYFGAKNAGSNYGMMNTGKAIGGLYAGLGSGLLFVALGSWMPVMRLNAVMVLVAALITLALKAPAAAPVAMASVLEAEPTRLA